MHYACGRMARGREEKGQRLRVVLGVAVVLALLGGAVALAAGTFSDDDAEGERPAQAGDALAVALPEQRIGDLGAAAEAAGCTVRSPPLEEPRHEDRVFDASDYKSNPPTSGVHNPVWYEDGIYEPGTAPDLGMQIHTLEHGRINVQYRPGTPRETIAQLEALLAEQSDGYHMLLYENVTDMEYAVAATAWGRSVGCATMSDEVFDVLRTFRAAHIDKGPESVP